MADKPAKKPAAKLTKSGKEKKPENAKFKSAGTFKPGQTGNPHGAPKKALSVAAVFRRCIELPRYEVVRRYKLLRAAYAKASETGHLDKDSAALRDGTSYLEEMALRWLYDMHLIDFKADGTPDIDLFKERTELFIKYLNRAYGLPNFAITGEDGAPIELIVQSVDEAFKPLEESKRVALV